MDQCLDEDDEQEALDTDQDMEDLMNWSKNGQSKSKLQLACLKML